MHHCIVIDDDSLAREKITNVINKHENWQVDCQSGNCDEAEDLLLKYRPDICFIDIQVSGGMGIELASKLATNLDCNWVFTSGSGEYALQAFEIEATDYLLKPFEDSRLTKVLQKVERLKTQSKKSNNLLAVKSVGLVEFVHPTDIFWIKGSANYVELHCANRTLLHRETLAKLEEKLNANNFLRVHRSVIVNVDKIKFLSSEFGRFSLLHLTNGDEVKLSRSYKAAFFEFFGLETKALNLSDQERLLDHAT